MSGHLEDKLSQRMMILMCFVLYLVLGFARFNYGACLSAILASEPMSRSQAGFVSTVNFLSFAVGTALSGTVADRIQPRRIILCGLLFSGISNLVFFSSGSYAAMVAAWCLNGLAQGPVFCSVMRLINDLYDPKTVTAPSIAVQSAFSLGLLVAYGASALILRLSDWRTVFLCAGLCALMFSAAWYLVLSWAEKRRAGTRAPTAVHAAASPAPSRSAFHLLSQAGLLLLPLALVAEGTLRDGVSTWGPTYIGELFGLDVSLAIASNTAIPILSVVGIFVANWVKLRLRHNELTTGAAFFLVSALSTALLLLTAGKDLVLSLVLLSLSTACMSAVNAMLINAIPLHFGAFGRTGTVTSILNTCVYAGSGLSTYGIGAMTAAFGWGVTTACWLLLAVSGAVVCLSRAGRWSRFKAEQGLI